MTMVTRVLLLSATFFGFELMFLSYLLFTYHPNLVSVSTDVISRRLSSRFVANCSQSVSNVSRTTQSSVIEKKNTTSPDIWFSTFLLILVPIRPGDIHARQLIRRTWFEGFENSSDDVVLRFAAGIKSLAAEKQFELVEENGTYGDIIFVNIKENMTALTNKTLAIMTWAHLHVNFSYMMKTDDDTYVFVKDIIVELRKRRTTTRLYFGKILFDNPIVRGNYKWADNDWDISPVYLPFAMGGGYILSHDVVALLSRNSPYLKWHINEDTAVGAWLSTFDVERRGDNRFCYCYKGHSVAECKMPFLAILLFGFTREELIMHFNHYHEQVVSNVANVTLLTPPTEPPPTTASKPHKVVRTRRTRPTTKPTESTDSLND